MHDADHPAPRAVRASPTDSPTEEGSVCRQLVHELSNELGAIQSLAELVEESVGENNSPIEEARVIREAANRGVGLCQQLYAELGDGRAPPVQRGAADLIGVIDRAMPLLHSVVGRRARLVLDLPNGLPVVLANEGQLHEVLLELVKNAARATSGGGDNARLEVTLRAGVHRPAGTPDADSVWLGEEPDGDAVFFEVSDSGCGMTKEVLDNLFTTGFTTKPEGSGLGMPSVLRIIQSHGGAITVRSVAARGATIRCLLPCFRHGGSECL